MDTEADFVNPNNLPVEDLSFHVQTDGILLLKKALDPYWVEQRKWTLYYPVPSRDGLMVGADDAWTSNAKALLSDLKFLLSLKHHRFWSYMIYEPGCMEMLVSFLQDAVPPYSDQPPESLRPVYDELRRRVPNVFCRLVTEKESESEWISRDYAGKVIYKECLFTIPVLWDLCLLYGNDNPLPIGRLLRSVFTLQPKYKADLDTAITIVQQFYNYTIAQVNHKYNGTGVPPDLPESFKFGQVKQLQRGKREASANLPFDIVEFAVAQLFDSALTLRIFTELYPPTVDALRKNGFVMSIVNLYEDAFSCIYEKFDKKTDSATLAKVKSQLEFMRGELIDIVREILAADIDGILCQKGNIDAHAENYYATIMDMLSEPKFIQDYNLAYPVLEDLDIICEVYPGMDTIKTDYILQAIYSNENITPTITKRVLQPNASTSGTKSQTNSSQTPSGRPTVPQNNKRTKAEIDIPSNMKEDALIKEVMDIMPQLGSGFILKCLEHYGFNAETVINHILEGSLDKSLQSLNQSLPIIPTDPLDQYFLDTGIDRLNVFDGDEFDIMTRDDVDLSRIHKGKRNDKFKDLNQMLDDKSYVKEHMDTYNKYNMVTDDKNLYCDEYDDTYDSLDPGEAAKPDDKKERHPFVKPRVLHQMERKPEKPVEEEPSTSNEQEATSSKGRVGLKGSKPMDFCVNPELLRERREAQWRANRKPAGPSRSSGDVVGKAKGQGQEKDVLKNREKKNENKSSRGNHNRRRGAQWKRTQGMMPS